MPKQKFGPHMGHATCGGGPVTGGFRHSLGTQITLRLAGMIMRAIENGRLDPKMAPQRVTLLEPFMTKGQKDYISGTWKTLAQILTEEVEYIQQRGVFVDLYRSSRYNHLPLIADPHLDLVEKTAYVRLRPRYHEVNAPKYLLIKHKAARWWYFSSYRMLEGPPEYITVYEDKSRVVYSPSGGVIPWARASVSLLESWQNSRSYAEQFEGKKTRTPTDDMFYRRPKTHIHESAAHSDEDPNEHKEVYVLSANGTLSRVPQTISGE
eukprot:gnl/Spiro4/7988_TR4199_c0_g1_i1.p2 gnl/Spiro4/7988_TR4199_c0_g1~~gnl/Spiro4/7988_TR4199_c0_g1_i1.p2  ORF type:complete len:265 (+),score=35.43 gnl/Spiro4/7988_TR4199_c0_g1_i1:792-1586(+)